MKIKLVDKLSRKDRMKIVLFISIIITIILW